MSPPEPCHFWLVTAEADGSWDLPGALRPDEAAEHLGVGVPEHEEYETLAGFLMVMLRRVPRRTDSVTWGGYDEWPAIMLPDGSYITKGELREAFVPPPPPPPDAFSAAALRDASERDADEDIAEGEGRDRR